MPFIKLSPQQQIHYAEWNPQGSQTVLLLHGLGVHSGSWALQVDPLQNAGYRVLAPDLRGFGKSTYPGGRASIGIMAEDAASLLASTQSAPAHVVGISMGGTVALQFALDHPDLVKKLVLVNTFAYLSPQSLHGWLYFITRFFLVHTLGLSTQAKFVAGSLFPGEANTYLREQMIEQVNQADVHGYRAAMRALARFNVLDRLNEIHLPTLVVTAENDTTVPPKTQAILAQRIPNAQQARIPNAGHAVIVDQAEEFNQILIEFLKGAAA